MANEADCQHKMGGISFIAVKEIAAPGRRIPSLDHNRMMGRPRGDINADWYTMIFVFAIFAILGSL